MKFDLLCFCNLQKLAKDIFCLWGSHKLRDNLHLSHSLQPNAQDPVCWDLQWQQGKTRSYSHISISGTESSQLHREKGFIDSNDKER